MRNRTKLALLILALPLAQPARALDAGDRSVSLFGGGAFPGGSVGDNAKLGLAGGAALRQQFTDHLSAVLDGEFMRFGDRRIAGGIDSGADVLAMGLSLRLDLPLEGRRHVPFLSVGPAMNRVTRRAVAPGIDTRSEDWTPGVAVSAGTMMSLGETLSLGPVGRYRSLGRYGYALEAGIELAFRLHRSAK